MSEGEGSIGFVSEGEGEGSIDFASEGGSIGFVSEGGEWKLGCFRESGPDLQRCYPMSAVPNDLALADLRAAYEQSFWVWCWIGEH